MEIRLHVQDSAEAALSIGGGSDVSLDVGATVIGGGMPYSGSYTVTPSAQAQTLPTTNRQMAEDIIINPIPSNYGLITWDGSTITVS